MRALGCCPLPLALVLLLLVAPRAGVRAAANVVFTGVVTTNGLLTATYSPDGTVTNTLGPDAWLGSVLTLTEDSGISGGSFQPAVAAPLIWSATDAQTTFIWNTPPLVGTPARPLAFFSATLLQGTTQPLLWVYSVEIAPDGTTSVTRGLLFLQ